MTIDEILNKFREKFKTVRNFAGNNKYDFIHKRYSVVENWLKQTLTKYGEQKYKEGQLKILKPTIEFICKRQKTNNSTDLKFISNNLRKKLKELEAK